jgi:cytochrome c oxidase subunit II
VRLLALLLGVDTSPLNPHGSVDTHMQNVFFWIFWVSVAIGVGVTGMLLYGFFKFRRKSDDEEPEQFHGNTRLEITWTILPFGILVALFVLSAVNMSYVVSTPANATRVSVVGEQFDWKFFYEDSKTLSPDGKVVFSGSGLAATPTNPDPSSVMFVAENTPTSLFISSTDGPTKCDGKGAGGLQPTKGQTFAQYAADLGCGVNHSFYIPTLAGQMNAIPGQVNQMWFDAQPGKYYGQCTELCGVGHPQMLIEVVSVPVPTYNCLMAHADTSARLSYDTIGQDTMKTCSVTA